MAKTDSILGLFSGLLLQEKTPANIRNRLKERARSETVKALRTTLPEILEEYCPADQTEEWRRQVRLVIQDLNDKIPNEETIQKIHLDSQENALLTINSAYQLTRKQVDNAFSGTQFVFDDTVLAVKQRLVRAFLECSKLDKLLPDVNYEDPLIVRKVSSLLFGEYNSDCEVLRMAFSDLDRFNVVQNNQLINWINGKTDVLDTNKGNGNIPSYWKDLGLTETIITKLQSLVDEIRESLNYDVEKLDSPIQQIRDKVYSFLHEISQVGSEYTVAWQNMFEPYIDKMYPEEFKEVNSYNNKVKSWNDSINKLMNSGSISHISFN